MNTTVRSTQQQNKIKGLYCIFRTSIFIKGLNCFTYINEVNGVTCVTELDDTLFFFFLLFVFSYFLKDGDWIIFAGQILPLAVSMGMCSVS